jgi:hypothetical protein
LLEVKANPKVNALIAQSTSPFRVHRSSRVPALATAYHPLNEGTAVAFVNGSPHAQVNRAKQWLT